MTPLFDNWWQKKERYAMVQFFHVKNSYFTRKFANVIADYHTNDQPFNLCLWTNYTSRLSSWHAQFQRKIAEISRTNINTYGA